MAKIKINCGGLQMQVGGLDRYMGGISPNSQKSVAVGASNSISGRASAPDRPEQVEKKARTTVGAAEGLPLPKELILHFLQPLNPTELAKMKEVSKIFNDTIKGDSSLNQKVQHGKYLSLAKQTAERIQYNYDKSQAYCAIATEEAKLNPDVANQTFILAKQTAELIQGDDLKSEAYGAIATEEAKSNLETAKQTAERIQDDGFKSKAYCAIAAALLHR